MARVVFLAFCLIVCAIMSVASSPAEREMANEKIREKGRMLFASFRQKARTLITMKRAEWKEADLSPGEMAVHEEIAERYNYVQKESEYEIKQRIVDAMAGDEPVDDPDLPRHSEEIATFFMEALFASTYAEQTSKEDSMMQILKDILEQRAHDDSREQ